MMKMGILHVTATKNPPYRTKINIRPLWLAEIGFVHGVHVYAIPRQGGFTLTLRNNGAENGKLIHVGLDGKKLSLTVNVAKNFAATELAAGDFLAVKYEYGVITAQKLPGAQTYYMIGSRDYDAHLQMCGNWISDAGFLPDTITIVAATNEGITLAAWKDTTSTAATYSDIVKFARERKCQIIQPHKNQHVTVVDISGYTLNRAGFASGDIVGINYDSGTIKLFKPDLQKLGF